MSRFRGVVMNGCLTISYLMIFMKRRNTPVWLQCQFSLFEFAICFRTCVEGSVKVVTWNPRERNLEKYFGTTCLVHWGDTEFACFNLSLCNTKLKCRKKLLWIQFWNCYNFVSKELSNVKKLFLNDGILKCKWKREATLN